MAEAGDYDCRLLADLLPACLFVADFFASSDDAVAIEARAGADSTTFHRILYYEFCRLQGGQVVTDDGSMTVLGVGVIPLLEMLESRTPRVRSSQRPPWSRKGTFEGLEALRSKVCGQNISIDIRVLRLRLRLSTSSQKSRKRIVQCLINCNPEFPLPWQLLRDLATSSGGKKRLSAAKAAKSPLARVSKLATRSHQLLCENWACTCVPLGSHVTAKLILPIYRSSKITRSIRFELLLSTSDKSWPWQETEIDVVADNITIVDRNAEGGEEGEMENSHDIIPKVQGRKVNFPFEECELKNASPRRERWKAENICMHVHQTLGSRIRLLVENNSIWRLRPTRPKIRDLRNAVHVSLSDLLQNGYFFQRISQKDRFILTYIIASSILSLYQGPWLDHDWTKDQIFFLSQAGDLATLDLNNPLLSTRCIAPDPTITQANPDNIHPEPRIAALGIVMLEIALGTTIESRRDDGPFNSNTDLLNAYHMLDQMQQDSNAIPKHVLAIKTCLQPEDIFEEDFSNESKQQSLHANIVGPLEAILEAYGIQTKDLDSTLGRDFGFIPQKVTRHSPKPRSSHMYSLGSIMSADIHPEGAGPISVGAKTTSDSKSAEKWFQDLRTFVFPLLPEDPICRVKIAILDSGIDLPIEVQYAYESRITYRSWIEGDDTNKTDTSGHGTHAAGLLLQVSPHAEIFVARVTRDGEFDRKIIAEAIEYATDVWEVDIITTSFGFREVDPGIDNALSHAAAKKTIIFAAACNNGNRHSIPWPASSEHVICIHSLDGDGDHSSYTPNPRPQDYSILGQAVSSYWPPHFDAGIEVLRSGTSCAAPIAAGVAALVLEYTQQKLPLYARAGSKVDAHIILRLRSNAGMRMIFGLMAENRGGHNCVIPWSLMNFQRKENTMCDIIWEKLRNIWC